MEEKNPRDPRDWKSLKDKKYPLGSEEQEDFERKAKAYRDKYGSSKSWIIVIPWWVWPILIIVLFALLF